MKLKKITIKLKEKTKPPLWGNENRKKFDLFL